mgnify:CR=1 FL=1
MAYSPPTVDEFKAIFPAFAAVADEAYNFWSAQAVLITEPLQDCLGARMDLATMRATAWYLTDAGIGTGAESEMAAQGASGFKRIKSGAIDLEKADATPAQAAGIYGSNSYGVAFYAMIRPCIAGPRVTGTGAVVGGCGFNGFAGPLPYGRY